MCLHFLDLLQYEHFRKEVVNGQCARFIDDQQILHWQHYTRYPFHSADSVQKVSYDFSCVIRKRVRLLQNQAEKHTLLQSDSQKNT